LEEINGDVLDADFGTTWLRICLGYNFRVARQSTVIPDVHEIEAVFAAKLREGSSPEAGLRKVSA